MDPFARLSAFLDRLAQKVVIAALVVAALVGAWMYLTREPTAAEELQRVNPGWTVVDADGHPVSADDASGGGGVMLGRDDVGPYRLVRVDCEEVRKVWPRWFALPDVSLGNCARLDDAGRSSWVLNVTTPMRVTEIWDRHFGPLLDRQKLTYAGGRSGRFPEGVETDVPAGQPLPEERGSGGYIVDPPPGSGERPVAISFHRWYDRTELVFTFRPPEPPSPPSAASAP